MNIIPTTPPQREFVIANITTFCSTDISGVVELYVQEFNGEIPGLAVYVRAEMVMKKIPSTPI